MIRICLAACLILCAAALVHAQADDPTGISVTADGNYRWQLDGVDQGRITAAHPVTVHATKGLHTIKAFGSDGSQVFSSPVTVILGKSTAVHIVAAHADRPHTASTEKPQPKAGATVPSGSPAKSSGPAHAGMEGVYADHATGLFWTAKDSGAPVPWELAADYCTSQRLAGFSDWRLPQIEELKGLYDPSGSKLPECRDSISGDAFPDPIRVRKGIDLGCYWIWSSTPGRSVPMRGGPAPTIMMFNFFNGAPDQAYPKSKENRVLCVRGNAPPA